MSQMPWGKKNTPLLCLHAPASTFHTQSEGKMTAQRRWAEQLRVGRGMAVKKRGWGGSKAESITPYIIYTRQTIQFQLD